MSVSYTPMTSAIVPPETPGMISTTPMTPPRNTSSTTRPTERREGTADGPAGGCEFMRASLPMPTPHLRRADAVAELFVLVAAGGWRGGRTGLVDGLVWPRPRVGLAFVG